MTLTKSLLAIFILISLSPSAYGFSDNFNVGNYHNWIIESGTWDFSNLNGIDGTNYSHNYINGVIDIYTIKKYISNTNYWSFDINITFQDSLAFGAAGLIFQGNSTSYYAGGVDDQNICTAITNVRAICLRQNVLNGIGFSYSKILPLSGAWWRIYLDSTNSGTLNIKVYYGNNNTLFSNDYVAFTPMTDSDRMILFNGAQNGNRWNDVKFDNIYAQSLASIATGTIYLYDYSITNQIASTVNLSNIKIVTNITNKDYSKRYWLIMTRPDSTNQVIELTTLLTTLPNTVINNLAVNQVGVWEFDLLECNGNCNYLDIDYLTVYPIANTTGAIDFYDSTLLINQITSGANLSTIYIRSNILNKNTSMQYWLIMTRPDSTNQVIELTTLPNPLTTNLLLSQTGNWEFDLLECNGSCTYLDTQYFYVYPNATDQMSLIYHVEGQGQIYAIINGTIVGVAMPGFDAVVTYSIGDNIAWFVYPYIDQYIVSVCDFPLTECQTNASYNYTVTGQLPQKIIATFAPQASQYNMTLIYHVEGQGQIYAYRNDTLLGVAMPGFDANVSYSIGDGISWLAYPYIDNYIASVCDFPLTECDTAAWHSYTVTGQLPQMIIVTFSTKNQSWPNVTVIPTPIIPSPEAGMNDLAYAGLVIFSFAIVGAAVSKTAIGFLGGAGIGMMMSSAGGLIDQTYFFLFVLFIILIIAFLIATKMTRTGGA